MPFTVATAPQAVRDALPAAALKIWVAAHTAALKTYKGDEGKAAATAWEAVKNKYKKVGEKWIAKSASVGFIAETMAALFKALGHGADGTAEVEKGEEVTIESAAGEIAIAKLDEDQRLIFAWSTVVSKGGKPVEDLQGHVIDAQEMQKAYHRYMMESRLGNDMHEGPDTSLLVEGMCFTKERQAMLNIDLGMEGYFGVWKILDDDVWAKIKAGERRMMSIEGRAVLEDLPEAA